jgi:hypothetical protein
MLALILALVFGYTFFQLAGYFVHKLLHNPFTGRAYKSHSKHHEETYTPARYLTKRYISPGWKDSPLWYYLPPAIVVGTLLFWFLPTHVALVLTAEGIFVGWLNDWLHEKIHIEGHWLERFDWFWRLRKRHWEHHIDDEINLGIFSFFPDKLVGTYAEVNVIPYYRNH